MTYVMEMSTDQDILDTTLNADWYPVQARYSWNRVINNGGDLNLNIPGASTIVVVAHGNDNEIGNAQAGQVDINADIFLAVVAGNVAAAPTAVYISSCGNEIAAFAAQVAISAANNAIWQNTVIYGHRDPVEGPVPPPNDIGWVAIYQRG